MEVIKTILVPLAATALVANVLSADSIAYPHTYLSVTLAGCL